MSKFLMFVTYCFRQTIFALQMKSSALKLPVGHERQSRTHSTMVKKTGRKYLSLAINDNFIDIYQLSSTSQWHP